MNRIEKTVWDLALPVVEQAGLEIWDVEYVTEGGQRYLRLFLDGPDGVDLDACERVSRQMDSILDTRPPRGPTQAPMGSTSGAVLHTAILVREPASRAMDMISTVPSAISGTSSSNSLFTSTGWVRLMSTWGPRDGYKKGQKPHTVT